MRGSFKIAEIAGIRINLHVTFLLAILFLALFATKLFFLIVALFFLVTLHEIAHSLVAKKFGINVKEITLLPIGGVASMTKMPEKPYQEFFISIAGPMTNIALFVIFYFPLKWLVGSEAFFGSFKSLFVYGEPVARYAFICRIFWMNLFLAVFNLLPAFPMDGGRILRSLLAGKLGFKRATKIAVNFGHAFALLFAYIGLMHGGIILIAIAVFIYMAASSEEMQVDLRTTLKRFKVKDILSSEFLTLHPEATLSKVLELIFHSKQEDFPVMDEGNEKMIGFVTRNDVISGIHRFGVAGKVSSVMTSQVPAVKESTPLDEVQNVMQSNGLRALPVFKDRRVIGLVTTEDINRVYNMMAGRR